MILEFAGQCGALRSVLRLLSWRMGEPVRLAKRPMTISGI
jgi:hypothetical protein